MIMANIVGDNNPNFLIGGADADQITGLAGDDVLYGGADATNTFEAEIMPLIPSRAEMVMTSTSSTLVLSRSFQQYTFIHQIGH
jgi:hypothetical protein